MKSVGFTLLELVISIAVAGILMVSLSLFLSQTSSYQNFVEDRATVYTRASVLLHQLEKDVAGAHVPIENILYEKQKKEAQQQKQDAKGAPKKVIEAASTKNKEAAKEKEGGQEKEEAVKPIARVFYATHKNKNISQLTFITNNPLSIYWSSAVGAPKPKIARVFYQLVPEFENPQSFTLMRQEGTNLDAKSYETKDPKMAQGFAIVQGIKSFSMRFVVLEDPKNKKEEEKDQKTNKIEPVPKKASAKSSAPQEPQLPKVTEYTEWNWPLLEGVKKEQKDEEKANIPFPSFVVCTLELWDTKYDRTFEFVYTLPTFAIMPDEIAPKQKKSEEQKDEAKKATTATPSSPQNHSPAMVADLITSDVIIEHITQPLTQQKL